MGHLAQIGSLATHESQFSGPEFIEEAYIFHGFTFLLR
jgi:hypothetical protein